MSIGSVERLAILIDINGAKAAAELKTIGTGAERELGKAEAAAAKTSASFSKMGAGMVLAGGLIAAGLFKATEAYAVQERAELQLQNTVANMPRLAGANVDALKAYAGELQKTTTFGDEATISAMALLGTFQVTEEQIKGMMPLVQDYAAKFDQDLNSAALQVGKALDGQIGALRRNGVSIDEALYKTDRFAAVQQALREQVGGFAEQEAQTFSGQLQQMKNDLGDVEEILGKGAVGGFSKILGPIKAATTGLHEMNPAIAEGLGGLLAIGSTGMIAVGVLSLIIGQAMKAKVAFAAMREEGSGMSSGTKAMAGLAAGALAVAAAVATMLGKYAELRDLGEDLNTGFVDTGKVKAATRGLEGIDAQLSEMRSQYDSLGQTIDDSSAPWDKDYRDQLGEFRDGLQGSIGDLEAFRAEIVALSEAEGISVEAAARLLYTREQAEEQAKNGISSEQIYAEKIDGTKEAYKEAAGAVEEMRRQTEDYFSELDKALGGAVDFEASIDDLTESLREHGSTLNIDTEAGRANLKAIQDVGKATRDHSLDVLEQTGDIDQAGAIWDAHRQKIIDQLTALGWSTEAINNYIAAAHLTPSDKATAFAAYTDDALADVVYLREQIDALPFQKRITIAIEQAGANLLGAFGYNVTPQHRAAGGRVERGRPYVVGELGPEPFVPDTDGTIIPHGAAAAGGTTVVVLQLGEEVIARASIRGGRVSQEVMG